MLLLNCSPGFGEVPEHFVQSRGKRSRAPCRDLLLVGQTRGVTFTIATGGQIAPTSFQSLSETRICHAVRWNDQSLSSFTSEGRVIMRFRKTDWSEVGIGNRYLVSSLLAGWRRLPMCFERCRRNRLFILLLLGATMTLWHQEWT